MGFADTLFGGGSQTAQTKLPDYIRQPADDIGTAIGNIFKKRGPALNSQQQQALTGIEQTASAGDPLFPYGQQFLGNIFGNGGLTQGQDALGNALVNGQFVNPAFAETARIAYGGDVGTNPYLEATFKRAADVAGQNYRENVIPGMDRAFASQGRLGSNAYANARNRSEEAYGRNVNDLATTIFGGAYEGDRNRQMTALGQLGGLGQEDVANRLQGANIFQQGTANQFGAAGMLPQFNQLQYADLDRLFSAGTTRQDARYAEANRAAGALGQLPYGQTTTQSASINPLSGAIGLGTSLLGLGTNTVGGAGLASLFGGGAAAGGAAAGGAGATGAAGLLAFSDARLKAGVTRIGALPSGLPLYRYRYLWDEHGTERVGVMAQEARSVFPEAVIETPGGWLAVDYARIG